MYGVAVVNHWAVDNIREMLDERHQTVFSNIPLLPGSPLIPENGDSSEEPDNPMDTEYVPGGDPPNESESELSLVDAALLSSFHFILFIYLICCLVIRRARRAVVS